MKKKLLRAAACLCAVLSAGALPVTAETVQDPEYPDVLLLDMESTAGEPEDPPDALCDAINAIRAENGAQSLYCDEGLMTVATARAEALTDTQEPANVQASVIYDVASETVVRGNADLNTMISAILLSEKQKRNLTDNQYLMLGYGCNEAQNVWVLILARPFDVHFTTVE